MAAGKYNFVIEAGATYTTTITYVNNTDSNIPITRARLSVKDHITDETYVYRATTNDSLDVGAFQHMTLLTPSGKFSLTIPATVTAGFTFNQGVYDCEVFLTDGSIVRILEGKFKVKPQVSEE
jgi:hypothetical protein